MIQWLSRSMTSESLPLLDANKARGLDPVIAPIWHLYWDIFGLCAMSKYMVVVRWFRIQMSHGDPGPRPLA